MSIRDLVPGWWGKREVASRAEPGAEPFHALQREMERAFANFWQNVEAGPLAWRTGFGLDPGAPRADVVERDGAVEVSVELPGVSEPEIDVTVASGLLTVKAEKKSERDDRTAGFRYTERSYGVIQRTIPLPAGADPANAKAAFKNGVLTVTVPTTAVPEREVRKIAVQRS